MDSGEGGGGGDGGGGEERDADLSLQALSLPFLTHAVVSEQGSSSHTSAVAPAKEPLTLPQQEEEEATEGSQARGETDDGEELPGSDHHQRNQENKVCQEQGMDTDFGGGLLSGRKEVGEAQLNAGKALEPGLPLDTASSSVGEEEEEEGEEAISNQSQTKSKCYLLPHQSQQSSSSSTAKASGTLNSKTAASPKPSPFLSTSPKHFNCPSFSSVMLSEGEAKYIMGDQGLISGSPKSFKSQQPAPALPPADAEPSCTPAEEDGTAGVLHSSISNGDGAKAPEPNEGQLDTDVDDDRDKEGEPKDSVFKNFNQELSPNSLTSQMTIMHSRNSCKTLKCPKCNWHYKSQHTLQLHMKEKHPENGGQCVCGVPGGKCVCGSATRGVCGYCSSGKPHPRLARGETYACGYKPYRCEVCDYATSSKGNLSIHMQSDKHLNNVQNGGHANSQIHTAHVANNNNNNSSGGGGGSSNGHTLDEAAYKLPLSSSTPAAVPVKSTPPLQAHSHGKRWRCDVCDYETSIARNLRIHTTSEKHTHNMLRLQRGYYLSHCRSLAPQLKHLQNSGTELSLNMRLTGQTTTEQSVTLGATLTPSPSPSPSPPPVPSLSPTEQLSHAVFQCLVCSCFSTDGLESIEQHVNTPRSLPQSEWCSLVAGGCHCRLCGYTTPLRANFSLHCQTDRHRTRYQLAAHLQEGGDRGLEGSAIIAKGNPVQLRCNLCDYITSSFEKLRGHSHSSHHEASVRVYRFLQQYDGEVDGGSWLFHCLLCNHSSSSKLQVLKHSQTPTHQQREALLQLQPMDGEELAAIFTIRKSQDGVTDELIEDMEMPCKTTPGLLDHAKDKLGVQPISRESGDSMATEKEKKCSTKRPLHDDTETETKRARTHQQNENQQTVQCPLCQVKVQYPQLRQHLTHIHSVAQDCVDKLISVVKPPPDEQQHLETEQQTDVNEDDSQRNEMIKTEKEDAPINSLTLNTKGEKADGDVVPPKDVTALLTPPLEENAGHPSNERPAPQSPTQTPPSSPPTSPPSDPPPHSDRHGYRFRCSRCSLAFPTQEKLQLHWQYHAMRAATECPLCSRQCRSQEALQRHIQNTHSQMDTQGQSLSLPSENGLNQENNSSPHDLSLSPEVGQEAGVEDDEGMEEEAGSEGKEEQEEIKECGLAGGKETALDSLIEAEKGLQIESTTEPCIASVVKKGSNPTMDRYLDPSRPYKCTICSESFTQKTILLVHYNSVSHLHRARRALQESSTGVSAPETPRGPDPRPYRCKLCGVGYSQSSTLDIHLRSVLHQTRARASQNPTTQISGIAPTNASSVTQKMTSSDERSKYPTSTKKQDASTHSMSSLTGFGKNGEHLNGKAKVAELIASRNQLMLLQQQHLAQAQAQAQAQLQHNALLQSQILQHLPIGAENLLQQLNLGPDNLLALQQQLLLPFYLSGDMTPNSDSSLNVPELGKLELGKTTMAEDVKTKAKCHPQHEVDAKQMTEKVENANNVSPNQKEAKPSSGSGDGKEEMLDKSMIQTEITATSTNGIPCPPPRVPFAAVNGESLRALLQSYGYELALQYIQNRHRHQQQMPRQEKSERSIIHNMEYNSEEEKEKLKGLLMEQSELFEKDSEQKKSQQDEGSPSQKQNSEQDVLSHKKKGCCKNGEKCKECGKFFSDAMILKSHQEYFHRALFPTAALERFSKEYRLQYDQMYPLGNSNNKLSTPTSQPSCASTAAESEPVEDTKAQVKTNTQIRASSISDASYPIDKSSAQSPPSTPEPPPCPKQEVDNTCASSSSTSQNAPQMKALPLSLPQMPMISLPMPQLQIPQLPLANLPFPMELPFIPPVVMQSMALQSQPWLDSSMSPELAKLFQSQLNPALLGQQTQMSQAMLHQQPQLSPSLLGQSPQLNPALLSQPSQPSLIQSGHQPQVSPSIPEQQGKRTRTRISEDQLTVLRKNFDINSLPSDEEINKMAIESGLPLKVIKHWFRNTLFKERQRDKDSPYNFNNPPTTELEECSDETSQTQNASVSPASLSPALPTNSIQQAQMVDFQRGELNRGRRSSRTRFTEKQLETLQDVFEATPYPREEEYDRLSALLSLPNRVIVVWFQNARQRARKSQDREADDDSEGKKQYDCSQNRKNDGYKNDDGNADNSCGDDGHNDSNNENSMDLTYEYYTHAESPAPDSSQCAESSLTAREESFHVKKKQESKVSSPNNKTPTETKNAKIPETAKKEQKESPPVSRHDPVSQTSHESTPTKNKSHSSYPQNTVPKIKSVSNTSLGLMHSPPADPVVEKPADISPSLPSAVESETNHGWQSGVPSEGHLQPQHKPANRAQFQCSLCPMSLTTFQHWQEHQTRHLLAAQSQVQLLHSGFTDRTMPYMMLHPNHSLMASQMLSGAISQMNPNATHPFISQLNSMQLKNSLPDHSSSNLTSLSQGSMTPMKQCPKVMSDMSFDQSCAKEAEEEHRRDKRQRTTITPEQLEVLYQRYSLDSNPTRGVLEGIARDVGLTRRVVQVWFQNTRARERKGQFRSMGPGSSFSLGLNHLRCPFCRALFKVKSALDAHMRSRHWADAERAGFNLSMANGLHGQITMSMSSPMERPSPSVSCNLNSSYLSNELAMKPTVMPFSSPADLNNAEEEDDYDEEDEEEFQSEEGTSMGDQGCLSPEGAGGPSVDWGDTQAMHQHHHQQQQRQRTQMSHFQVLQLRDFYRSHRTPNRHECESLGQKLGLPHRVVQVWFQNARAKEKRARSMTSDSAEREQAELTAVAGERDRA